MFHFNCFNVEDPHDPSVGLIDGQLSIPGNLLRREVFDPVIGQARYFYIRPTITTLMTDVLTTVLSGPGFD